MKRNRKEDRLSGLPDDILIKMLSLLEDPREIVQTWLLSKRWCALWRFAVPCLNIHDLFMKFQREGKGPERFENFMSSFLCLRDGFCDVHTFKLDFGIRSVSPNYLSWACYALKHNLKIFELVVPFELERDLTNDIFSCESLEELDIGMDGEIALDNVSLPKLEEARFYHLTLNQDGMQKFISGCSALEILNFCFCALNVEHILLQSVKQLNIVCCPLGPTSASIFAPELEYLYFWDFGANVKFEGMSKLQKAMIEDHNPRGTITCEYISGLSCAYDIKIDGRFSLKKILETKLPSSLTFHNLKSVYFGSGCVHCGDFDALPSFLRKCPNLSSLTLCLQDNDCEKRDTHNDLDACDLARLLAQSTGFERRVILNLLGTGLRDRELILI